MGLDIRQFLLEVAFHNAGQFVFETGHFVGFLGKAELTVDVRPEVGQNQVELVVFTHFLRLDDCFLVLVVLLELFVDLVELFLELVLFLSQVVVRSRGVRNAGGVFGLDVQEVFVIQEAADLVHVHSLGLSLGLLFLDHLHLLSLLHLVVRLQLLLH